MAAYTFTKAPVNTEQLSAEITVSVDISAVLTHIAVHGTGSDNLIITFADDLLAPEYTALGVIVAAHVPKTYLTYRMFCNTCDEYYSQRLSASPAVCPQCGESVSGVVQDTPMPSRRQSPDGSEWDEYLDNDGTLILAKRK